VLKLSPAYRASLAKELLASLDSMSESELQTLWEDEAIRRDDEIDQGSARLDPISGALNRARARRK
ncbi:MAG: addiction module antitoxin RelB, partial [Syntrophobacterales bacterium GWC2_56_13]